MKKFSIDKRLLEIANLVDECDYIADIGTDHGYLPIYLVLNNKVKYAIASDVARLPLASAKENITKYGLQDKIETILCSGLTSIPNHVNTVIMAGMGANLIIDIIKDAKYKYDTYILQANLNVNLLRKFLSENGFEIIDEKVTFVHKKYYEILKVKQGTQILNEKQIKYGPINLKNKDKIFIDKWENIINTYSNILVDFKGSEEEKKRLKNEINDIKESIY